MTELNGIRAIPNQTFNITIEKGLIVFKLIFRPAIEMWMIDVVFGDFEVYGIRVCNSPNLLEQFSEFIPFGLLCSVGSDVGYEPSVIDDFSSGRVTLNILDRDEMDQIDSAYVTVKDEGI